MSSRRDFILTSAASIAAVTAIPVACSSDPPAKRPSIPQQKSARIRSARRREDTLLRLSGLGDNFHMTWGADDAQYVAVCDGTGWIENPARFYNSRLFAVDGHPPDVTFRDVPGYPEMPLWDLIKGSSPGYYGFGTLALDGGIYQFLSAFGGGGFVGAKLIYSPDNGRTWCNQNGSTPVVWESWEEPLRQNMVFFEEPQKAFSLLTVLQMGRGLLSQSGRLCVCVCAQRQHRRHDERARHVPRPQGEILDRGAYEYFAGLEPGRQRQMDERHRRARRRAYLSPRLGEYARVPIPSRGSRASFTTRRLDST